METCFPGMSNVFLTISLIVVQNLPDWKVQMLAAQSEIVWFDDAADVWINDKAFLMVGTEWRNGQEGRMLLQDDDGRTEGEWKRLNMLRNYSEVNYTFTLIRRT